MNEEKRNHTLMDQKCPTCGSWMKTIIETSPRGMKIITYRCDECGLNYRAEG
ncbi:MAG: hypothetical protein C5S43_00810 [Candidatus Methanocomedens sp.]|nr:MAG: hypothetical protein C5S43_00810 [ANME-2 cluster archaeon]